MTRAKHGSLFAVLLATAILAACGGKNGLVGGGKGNSVFLKSIDLSPVNPTVTLTVSPQPSATKQFTVIGHYNVGNPKDITDQMTWLSADPKVATVDAKGIATATGSGRVIIATQIFDPGAQKTLEQTTVLTVVPQLTGITISPASAQIAKETSQQFTASGAFNDGTHADITALVAWNSSQPVVTISSSAGSQGMALGVTPGATSITATMGAMTSAPAALTVTNANLVSLKVTPAPANVSLSSRQQFVATGSFDDGTTQNIAATAIWNSSNPAIARVTSVGAVTGLGLGTADITASMNGISDTAAATVDASSVSKITIVPVAKVANRTSAQMRAVAIFTDGSSLDVTTTPGIAWSSSNTAVAIVAVSSGLASGQGPGSASISAKLGSLAGSTTLNVSDASIQSLVVAPNQAIIASGTTQNVIALATFADSAGHFQQDISSAAEWTSDNTAVATVAFANGLQELASGLTTGTANVSAAFSDAHANVATGSSALNVSSASLTGISVSPGNANVTFGGGQQFFATGNFTDGTQQDLTRTANWSATDPAVADVSPFGFAGAGGPGQTGISATWAGHAGSGALAVNAGALLRIDICAATVADPLSNCPPLDPLTTPPAISFAKVIPYGVIAIGTFTDGSREDLTSSVRWTSSNASIATISNNAGIPGFVTGVSPQGGVTGLASGHVTLTASAGGVSGTSDVIVTDATPMLINVTPFNATVQQGLTQPLIAVATFTDNTTEIVTPYVRWTTSDPAIAVIYPGGIVYPVGTGVATVTATLNGAAGTATLSVQ
jgi:hypothetical protein